MARTLRSAGAVIVLLLFPALVLAQSSTGARIAPAQQKAPTRPSQTSPSAAKRSGHSQRKKKQLPAAPKPRESSPQLRQTTRMMWIVPNFAAVSPGVKFSPMTPKQKFWMATEDSFDYSSFVWTGVLAAQSYALDQYPELGTGRAAYGRYYWRGVLDGVSNSYFSEAIVPVLTHEDARYFTLGRGGFFRRLGYALTRVVVTYSDSGRNTFNISEVGGDFASSALSTAYYPPQERGMAKISEGLGTQLESAALNNIAKEFWPDIRRDVFRER